MRISVAVFLLALCITSSAWSQIQRKPIAEVSTDEMTDELQVEPANTGGDFFNLNWWIPNEFWEASTADDAEASSTIVDAFRGYTIVAVVAANISGLGVFNYYSEQEVVAHLNVQFIDAGRKSRSMQIVKEPPTEVQMILGMMKPMLKAAMGAMGEHFHFIVLKDRTESGTRIADPYAEGSLSISFKDRLDRSWTSAVDTPLNSLYVPRLCPNGKPAHISWKYCPWTGKKL